MLSILKAAIILGSLLTPVYYHNIVQGRLIGLVILRRVNENSLEMAFPTQTLINGSS